MVRLLDTSNYYLYGLLVVGVVLFYIFRFSRTRDSLNTLFSSRLIKYYFEKISFKKYGLFKILLFSFGCLFVLLALFRPQYGSQKLQMNAEGVELVFVVDVSQSMAAEDVKPQRLKLAQIQLKKLVQIIDGNRMGLVAFAGQVGVISPLTQDIGALNLFIDSLDFDIFTEQGTNMDLALQEAEELLKRGQKESAQEKTKVIVLITDGEDHSTDTLKTVQKLSSDGIRTFVIGVGTAAGGKIPKRDKFGQVIGYLEDSGGNPVVTKPNFKFLKEISRVGKGGFYKLDFGSVANKAIARDFESLKKSKFDSQSFEVKGEYFQIFLVLGLISLLLSFYFPMNSGLQKVGSLMEVEDAN